MKRYRGLIGLCFTVVLLASSCIDQFMVKKDESEKIWTPSSAAVSPKMDFEKISSVAIIPFFAGGGIDDPQFADQLGSSFVSELTVKQSQWKIVAQKDVLNSIIKNNLGRGYKNFQADYNTASGQMNAFVLTEETKNFLKKLSSVLKVDAIIYGSYSMKTGMQNVKTILGPTMVHTTSCNVSVALYYIKNDELWWKASDNKTSNEKDKLVSDITKSLSAYIGKGTLMQL